MQILKLILIALSLLCVSSNAFAQKNNDDILKEANELYNKMLSRHGEFHKEYYFYEEIEERYGLPDWKRLHQIKGLKIDTQEIEVTKKESAHGILHKVSVQTTYQIDRYIKTETTKGYELAQWTLWENYTNQFLNILMAKFKDGTWRMLSFPGYEIFRMKKPSIDSIESALKARLDPYYDNLYIVTLDNIERPNQQKSLQTYPNISLVKSQCENSCHNNYWDCISNGNDASNCERWLGMCLGRCNRPPDSSCLHECAVDRKFCLDSGLSSGTCDIYYARCRDRCR